MVIGWWCRRVGAVSNGGRAVQSRDEEDEADFFPVSGISSGGGGFRPRFPLFSFPSHPFSSLLTM
jgi:hypothetical protein